MVKMPQAEIEMRVLAVSVFGLLTGQQARYYGPKIALAIRGYMLQLLGTV